MVHVDRRRADVLVTHVGLHVSQRELLHGQRAEAVAQVVPAEGLAARAGLAQMAEADCLLRVERLAHRTGVRKCPSGAGKTRSSGPVQSGGRLSGSIASIARSTSGTMRECSLFVAPASSMPTGTLPSRGSSGWRSRCRASQRSARSSPRRKPVKAEKWIAAPCQATGQAAAPAQLLTHRLTATSGDHRQKGRNHVANHVPQRSHVPRSCAQPGQPNATQTQQIWWFAANSK